MNTNGIIVQESEANRLENSALITNTQKLFDSK